MIASELKDRLEEPNPPLLLDVRTPEENQFVALPNSTLIPLQELAARFEELNESREREIVVYCHHGMRSRQAIGFLREVGFTKLHNLEGGIDAWSLLVGGQLPRY